MKKIGWIGLGNMGSPMAQNLENAGFSLIVYNRSHEKTKPFADRGIEVAKSLSQLITSADIIFTMVSDDTAISAIFDEVHKTGNLDGKIFVDMSTISHALSKSIAQRLRTANAFFLDAPVAGSTKPAAEGNLVIMVGGDLAVLDEVRPYLNKIGKLVKHLGANGTGIAAKLAVNYFLAIIYQGVAETTLFAEQNGIKRADILEIINESPAGSGATRVKTPSLVSNEFPPAFALDFMLKDILLARAIGADFPLTPAMIETYQNAKKSGFGEDDVMAITKYIAENR